MQNQTPKIKLAKGEHVIACVPEYAHGPGWSNSPLWVYIGDFGTKTFRAECLQPDEQTLEMLVLFGVCAAAHTNMLQWVMKACVVKEDSP